MKIEILNKEVHSYIDWNELVNRYKALFLEKVTRVDAS